MIDVQQLGKRYGRHVAVADVSFSCPPGTITGFLGPNGAGKSTTMRMICGLTRPSSGSSTVAGVPYVRLPNPARQVGLLLDASAQHSGRSGRETLVVAAQTMGVARRRADELLELVGLTGAAVNRRVGGYSLGMRQRLGIAQALLGEPGILVLDEPANGLDPEGILWMRGLLRDFADGGGTVLLSSHLLHEVEEVADRLVVISGGRVVAQGAVADLLAAGGVRVRAEDPAALRRALAAAGIAVRPEPEGGALLAESGPEAVGRAAARAGVVLLELRRAAGVEELFMALTAAGGAKEAA
jgi:ABC-2 type transport system ATP-binding protein